MRLPEHCTTILVADFQLPSIRTLTRITSKIGSVEDVAFLKGVLDGIPIWQRRCILLWDEVYISRSHAEDWLRDFDWLNLSDWLNHLTSHRDFGKFRLVKWKCENLTSRI